MQCPNLTVYLTNLLVRLSVLILPLAIVSTANAQSQVIQAGNVLFKTPAGWQRHEQNGTVTLLPPGDSQKQAKCSITIMPGEELKGDFRAWYEAKMATMKTGTEVVGGGQIIEAKLQEGYRVLCSLLITTDALGGFVYSFYLAAQPGNRVEMIVYTAVNKEYYDQYQPVFDALIDSLDFANIRKSPANSDDKE